MLVLAPEPVLVPVCVPRYKMLVRNSVDRFRKLLRQFSSMWLRVEGVGSHYCTGATIRQASQAGLHCRLLLASTAAIATSPRGLQRRRPIAAMCGLSLARASAANSVDAQCLVRNEADLGHRVGDLIRDGVGRRIILVGEMARTTLAESAKKCNVVIS
jgi:hypothetical protein